MFKKIIVIILAAISVMLSLSGCGVGTAVFLGIAIGGGDQIQEAFELKEEDHIKFNYLNDLCDLMEYDGNIYYLSPSRFHVEDINDFVEIGWSGQRWRYNYVYADAIEEPTILFAKDSNSYFIKESFNCYSEEYNIEGCSVSIVFNVELTKSVKIEVPDGVEEYELILSSVKCPSLKFKFSVFRENDSWYAYGGPLFSFQLSDRLVGILDNNGLIS